MIASQAKKPWTCIVRSGNRFGLRTRVHDAQQVYELHKPQIPCLTSHQVMTFHVGPMPHGSNRAAISKLFHPGPGKPGRASQKTVRLTEKECCGNARPFANHHMKYISWNTLTYSSPRCHVEMPNQPMHSSTFRFLPRHWKHSRHPTSRHGCMQTHGSPTVHGATWGVVGWGGDVNVSSARLHRPCTRC